MKLTNRDLNNLVGVGLENFLKQMSSPSIKQHHFPQPKTNQRHSYHQLKLKLILLTLPASLSHI